MTTYTYHGVFEVEYERPNPHIKFFREPLWRAHIEGTDLGITGSRSEVSDFAGRYCKKEYIVILESLDDQYPANVLVRETWRLSNDS